MDKKTIERIALENAVLHEGKANFGSVMGKTLSEIPELKKDIEKAKKLISEVVEQVNKLGIEEQKKRTEQLGGMLKKEKREDEGLPELEGASIGKVATRFAPAPTGPLHISHLLRAAFLSYLYAKKYNGKFYLRIEDTDSKKVKAQFYDFIQEDLKSVGIIPDVVCIESDDLELYIELAQKLVEEGKAYVCLCGAEEFRELKLKKKNCEHRKADKKLWKEFVSGKFSEGQAVVRLMTSMKDKNPVLRDPPIMRISDTKHPKKPDVKLWPLYNFACVIEDHKYGITHVFRAKEHEHNSAVQDIIYGMLGWKMPIVINFGMIYLKEGKVHKRDMRKGMDSGQYTGWDDVKLPTVRAYLRRGFEPETFRKLAEKTGLSKNDITLGMENLEGINRKLIDPKANRYFAVLDPVKIKINGGKQVAELANHPDFPQLGTRKIKVSGFAWISGADYKELDGKEVRLIGLGNFLIKGKEAKYTDDRIDREMRKIQFVGEGVPVEIIGPGETLSGLGEESMKGLKVGQVIHMPRIGFARVDLIEKGKVRLAFAHK